MSDHFIDTTGSQAIALARSRLRFWLFWCTLKSFFSFFVAFIYKILTETKTKQSKTSSAPRRLNYRSGSDLMTILRKNWIKHGKILSLVKINSAKTQLTQFSLSCCQRADFSVLSQKRWDKLALFYKHNTNPNENSQFKHWFYIRSYRVKLNSSVIVSKDIIDSPLPFSLEVLFAPL